MDVGCRLGKVQGLSLEQSVIDFDLRKYENHLGQDKYILRLVGKNL